MAGPGAPEAPEGQKHLLPVALPCIFLPTSRMRRASFLVDSAQKGPSTYPSHVVQTCSHTQPHICMGTHTAALLGWALLSPRCALATALLPFEESSRGAVPSQLTGVSPKQAQGPPCQPHWDPRGHAFLALCSVVLMALFAPQ